jgi:hypothetical protein
MDSRVNTILWVWGSFLLLGILALTGLINAFLPSVEKSKRIKRIAVIFFSIVFLIIVVIFILSHS